MVNCKVPKFKAVVPAGMVVNALVVALTCETVKPTPVPAGMLADTVKVVCAHAPAVQDRIKPAKMKLIFFIL